jgi:catechol 2,3-dioxygenase-like lactoylglutathione lyase family enzyme
MAKKKSAKKTTRKAPARKAAKRKIGAGRKATPQTKKAAAKGPALDFNHAMIYSNDVGRASEFYSKRLGFQMVDDFRHEGRLLYARLRAPGGSGTIAIHQLAPGKTVPVDEGVRLYFEVRGLDEFCRALEAKGRVLDSLPKSMPWGWRHAYLHDPDGHEISLYWAGENRFRRTMMR